MTRYLSMRLVIIIPTLFATLMIVFLLGYLGPIDPVTILRSQWAAQGVYLNEEEVADLRSKYGLDRPFHEQFGTYMGNLLQGKFGYSFLDAAPIWPRIKRALPVSGQLALGVLAIMAFIGIPLGMLAARFHNTWLDYSIVSGSLFFWSIPPYVLVPVMLIIAVLWLDIMNVPRGWKGPLHPSFFIAAAIISTRSLASVIRQTRGGILEVMQNDFVRTARAKGLTEVKVMARHVARNALIPVVTSLGLLVDDFMWGAVFVDLAFNLPGLGRLFEQGLSGRDFNMINGVVLFTAGMTMGLNLIVDLIYPFLDPRVAYD
ncbi:MAG: ABC transporter permease [Caldilineaceae bacterium SB0670_bin_27]|uniref:ABC transporter permease n=1 Tax=Caldilineaceae bacterium SB0664_bin_27 TaxID=2605260 RepID=A0A6B0YQY4_9CHLR|nr:ABC transporter permease [Caldilineaceae bacterium]MDE0336959.1 ABC transporter permease [Caldilineaceae bacterium]MXY92621.1 ABC transporter permease [Caldilineaceae bacterium SB0664_bin_27]MYJ77074.1 ABC transporter permease [Caldilineaceae bacterium SB0670_bin_27]